MTGRRIVQANGVELCVETFGDPAGPAILLIGGAASSMDWWDDEFCERLAAGLPGIFARSESARQRIPILRKVWA